MYDKDDRYNLMHARPLLYLLFKFSLPKATQLCIEADLLTEYFHQQAEDYNNYMHDRLCGCTDGRH